MTPRLTLKRISRVTDHEAARAADLGIELSYTLWIRNQAFLDTAIRMGSEIQLATPLDLMRQGTYFEREVSYLTSKGFVPDNSGRTMIQGGKK